MRRAADESKAIRDRLIQSIAEMQDTDMLRQIERVVSIFTYNPEDDGLRHNDKRRADSVKRIFTVLFMTDTDTVCEAERLVRTLVRAKKINGR